MSPPASPITLLTDFGTADGYVAAMKGVLRSMAPTAPLDDAGHDVLQGHVSRAAWALSRYWNRYPEGTVHLVVVDPGVGTERRALAVEADGRFLVAPDNGVLGRVLDAAEEWRAVEAVEEAYLGAGRSATFHGRDVFAPVAGHLARGVRLGELGPPVNDPVRLDEPEPVREGRRIRGRIVTVDRFGNLISNIPGGDLAPGDRVEVAGRRLSLEPTYASVEPGQLLALVNSADRLEIAVRDGSAARTLGAAEGLELVVVGSA